MVSIILIILQLFFGYEKNQNEIIISGSYCAMGIKNPYDAIHAFNRRISDKFGGYINQKIDSALLTIRNNGFKSDIKSLDIKMDPETLTVYWTAVLGESTDGNSYTEIDSRGSAGGGLSAAKNQIPKMHTKHPNKKPVLFLDYNFDLQLCFDYSGKKKTNCNGFINIRQLFFKYY